jgi:hypothetical protein
MVSEKNQVNKLYGVHEPFYGFDGETWVALVHKFNEVTIFFIRLDFLIVYLFIISKKNSFG